MIWSLALASFPQNLRASPAWPPPPRATSRPTTSAGSDQRAAAAQELDQNLTLIKGNNAPEARKLGALKLLEANDVEATRKLDDLLRSKTPDLAAQIGVCSAIADFEHPPPTLMFPLLALLGDPRPGLAEVLVPALHRFERTPLIDQLRPIAMDRSENRPRRLAAIAALGATGDEKAAVTTLVDLLDDTSRSVRVAALAALGVATGIAHGDAVTAKKWWTAHAALSQADWLRSVNEARSGQIRSLAAEKTELTKRLIAAYRDTYLHTPEAARTKFLQSLLADALPAVRSLGLDLINDLITDRKEINQELRPLIVGTLIDPDPKVRMMAARMVSDLRMTVALVKLTDAAARESSDDVRAAQIAALGRLDDVKAIPTLIERLSDESSLVVGEAAVALGNLARRGHASAEETELVGKVLRSSFDKTPIDDPDQREKLLLAMANLDTPNLRPLFEREMGPDRRPSIRRAAIAGLASGGDPSVAELVRPLLSSPEPEIRLAVVDALGKCGRTMEDLNDLARHLGTEREPDANIRQRAWDSYLLVLQHLPAQDRFATAERFDLADDKTAQRRRLDILKALKADAAVYDPLSADQKVELLEQTAAAQLHLADFVAAAASLEQATGLLKDPESPRYAALAGKCVAALLHGHEDEHAIQRLRELTDGELPNGEVSDVDSLAKVLRDELRSRISTADAASDYENVLDLLALSTEFIHKVGPGFEQEAEAIRTEALSKRDAAIDHLLAAIASDPEAEARLVKDDQTAVLSRIYQKLTMSPATTSRAMDDEERLVKLARRLAPQWPGYAADASEEEKSDSLTHLREICETSKQNHSAVRSIESTTSAPAEKKIGFRTAENREEP